MLIVSPYTKGVGMVHSYGDHVSFDKFVEANWSLPTLAKNTRDNLPNPITTRENPYAPVSICGDQRHDGRVRLPWTRRAALVRQPAWRTQGRTKNLRSESKRQRPGRRLLPRPRPITSVYKRETTPDAASGRGC